MGTRAGEVTDRSAIIWIRVTKEPARNTTGVLIPGRTDNYKANQLPQVEVPVAELEGACPGMPGCVRLRYGTKEDLNDAITTDWMNEHAGGSPGKDPAYHRFHLVKGGFISTTLTRNADKSHPVPTS